MPAQDAIFPIPVDTARAAKAVYGNSHIFISIGDKLSMLLTDLHTSTSNHTMGRSRLGKAHLALITCFQYTEELSDRQAAEAIGARIDWKYALHLPLNYLGLKPVVLCEYRQALLLHPTWQQEFQRLLDRLQEGGYLHEKKGQPILTLDIVCEVCMRTRLDRVMSGMRHTLQAFAARNPEWLRQISRPHWYSLYEGTKSQPDPADSIDQQRESAENIGEDIAFLLEAISQDSNHTLASTAEAQELYQVWREQFDPIHLDGVELSSSCYLCGATPIASEA